MMADDFFSRKRRSNRQSILEKKRAVENAIEKAASIKDHLARFPAFHRYGEAGLSLYLESENGNQLSLPTKKYILNLLKLNMEGPYGTEWPSEEKTKRKEMVSSEARYILVQQHQSSILDANSLEDGQQAFDAALPSEGDTLVGFLHYRFVIEEDIPVLYVYELQLKSQFQGKGLGKFLMQLAELIAQKNKMGAVVLTVQKANARAMNFYKKLGYIVSSISPSRVDGQIGAEKSYEILCKALDSEAKFKLEKLI